MTGGVEGAERGRKLEAFSFFFLSFFFFFFFNIMYSLLKYKKPRGALAMA